MARIADREKARRLRKEGRSYSEIKQTLHVGKGTLSIWLRDMPLSSTQLKKVRDFNPKRIEKFRETMRNKRELRLQEVYQRAKTDIGRLSKREIFLTGLYLYWGEGSKTAKGSVIVTNTDPGIHEAFLDWLKYMGVPKKKVKVRLHLYKDMDIRKEILFWSRELRIPISQFRPPYIKDSRLQDISYKNGYGHGTCNLSVDSMALWEYITMALRRIKEIHARSSMVEQSTYTRPVGGSSPSGRTW